MFEKANQFNGDISSWDTSLLDDTTDMFLFNGAFNRDLDTWNTSSLKMTVSMFEGSKFNGNISTWDVTNFENPVRMFAQSAFNSDISSWNTSFLKLADEMFQGSDFNQDLSSWDVSSLERTAYMFKDAQSYSQNLCAWREKLPKTNTYNLYDAFTGTNCTEQQDPGHWKRSPYCEVCPYSLARPAVPTSAPSMTPPETSGARPLVASSSLCLLLVIGLFSL